MKDKTNKLVECGGIGKMKKSLKKVVTFAMAAGIGFSMSVSGSFVYAGQKTENASKSVRYKEPEEWNQPELKAYQFDSTDKFETYLLSGGSHLYNKNFKQSDRMIKITVVDPGYFVVGTDTDGDGLENIRLYDATKKKVLAKTTSDGDLEYGRIAKAGEVFYVYLPEKISRVTVMTGVIKSEFGSMKASDTYYEAGTGKTTYHPFSISKRSAVEFNVTAIQKNGGTTYAHIEKKEKGKWNKLDAQVKIKAGSYDDDFIHGLAKGEYRLAIKAPKTQVNAVSYTKSSKSKNVAYRRSKAKNIRLNDEISNIYTTGEKAERWYKVKVTSTKKIRELSLGEDTVSGGYKFTIYQSGSKKKFKTIKVTKEASAKMVKLPKKKATYYIKVSKLTSKTNGVYEIGYY